MAGLRHEPTAVRKVRAYDMRKQPAGSRRCNMCSSESYDLDCLRCSQTPSNPEEIKRSEAGSGVGVGGGAGESGVVPTVVPPRVPPPPPLQPGMIGGTTKPPL